MLEIEDSLRLKDVCISDTKVKKNQRYKPHPSFYMFIVNMHVAIL
mgnify:CR=1 FL=1